MEKFLNHCSPIPSPPPLSLLLPGAYMFHEHIMFCISHKSVCLLYSVGIANGVLALSCTWKPLLFVRNGGKLFFFQNNEAALHSNLTWADVYKTSKTRVWFSSTKMLTGNRNKINFDNHRVIDEDTESWEALLFKLQWS